MTRELDGLVAQLRNHAKQEALREALLVPWTRLEEAARAYVDWHVFVLWVRTITESAEDVPEIVRSALGDCCPGFFDAHPRRRFDWRALDEWIADHRFGDARTGGWFRGLTYYANKDIRTEQGWTLWERNKAAWSQRRPPRWPTLAEWIAELLATHGLSQTGPEKARAAEAMAHVDADRLRKAVSYLLECRALAIWVGCVSKPQYELDEFVMSELGRRFPDLVPRPYPAPKWEMPFFLRLVRVGDAHWRAVAREEGWLPALRYHLRHHPRYQRLVHYRERCHDAWSQSRPIRYPSFTEWLAAADAYFVRPAA